MAPADLAAVASQHEKVARLRKAIHSALLYHLPEGVTEILREALREAQS